MRIQLQGFMTHANTDVTLPARGVVLITGENGAGKSTLAEALAYGQWGRTLRDKDPWGAANGLLVLTRDDGLVVTRTLKKGSASLAFTHQTVPPCKYENNTKAQDALDQLVGPWDTWRRAAVFSSQDAAHFTLASDGERKRLLESILGIERFDGGSSACRDDLRTAERAAEAAERDCKVLEERKRAAGQRLADALALAATSGSDMNEEAAAVEVAGLEARAAAVRAEADKLRSAITTCAHASSTLQAEARMATRNAANVDVVVCGTCRQAVPPALRVEVHRQAHEVSAKAQEAEAAARIEASKLHEAVDELAEEERAFWTRAQGLRQALAVYRANGARREQAAKMRKEAGQALVDAEEELEAAQGKAATANHEAAVLRAVDKVLGLRGVRANVLGRALSGLEAVANAWLGRIAGPGFALKLGAYTNTAKGAVTDKISIEVQGAGGGHGYKGASGGERRRLDVAILLALGEVSAGAQGFQQDILTFDEVLDALDKPGVEAVVEAVRELAEERLCVVITHNENVISAVRADVHYNVAAGVLTQV